VGQDAYKVIFCELIFFTARHTLKHPHQAHGLLHLIEIDISEKVNILKPITDFGEIVAGKGEKINGKYSEI
jgi:hypothetical protein